MGRFEDGLIERLETQYGGPAGVDVHRVVACVLDMVRRKPVRNPSGLLVEWVRKESRKLAGSVAMSPAAVTAEQDRYAAFQVEIYRMVATSRITPAQLGTLLLEARQSGGMKLLNSRTIERLQSLGHEWPTTDSPGKGD